MTDNPLEMPQAMRELAEQNIRPAHAAYEQSTDLASKNVSVGMGVMPSPMTAGLEDVRERAMDFATENSEAAFTFAGKVCNAKSREEILALQTQFAQDRMRAFTTQTQELYRLAAEAFQKAARH